MLQVHSNVDLLYILLPLYVYVCACTYVGVLKMMQARIETLRSTLDRVTARVSEPHAKIMSRTVQLSRLQVAPCGSARCCTVDPVCASYLLISCCVLYVLAVIL